MTISAPAGRFAPPLPPRPPDAVERRPPAAGLLFTVLLVVVAIEYLGIGADVPLVRTAHVTTLLAWGVFAAVVAGLGPRVLVESAQARALLGFVVFSAVSVLWALVRTYVGIDLRSHLDYFALFVATAYLVDRPQRLRPFSVAMTVVVLVLVARNLDSFWAAARVGALRAGYFVADGNDFGWTLVTLLLFPLHLLVSRQPPALRTLGFAGCAAAVVGITGTGSRGAALALGAAGIYYWLVLSRHRLLSACVLCAAVVAVVALSPQAYIDRLQTIAHYQDDSSAQGRLRAWKAAGAMAIDRPLGVGAGNFNSAYGRFYMPADAAGWGASRWISPHSVYFRTLGEYGFPGVALLLFLIGKTLWDNHVMVRNARRDASHAGAGGEGNWPAMLNLGLVGYAVGGAFLGGLTYPHIYLLAGLTVACRRMRPSGRGVDAGAGEGAGQVVGAGSENAPRPLIEWQPPAARAAARGARA